MLARAVADQFEEAAAKLPPARIATRDRKRRAQEIREAAIASIDAFRELASMRTDIEMDIVDDQEGGEAAKAHEHALELLNDMREVHAQFSSGLDVFEGQLRRCAPDLWTTWQIEKHKGLKRTQDLIALISWVIGEPDYRDLGYDFTPRPDVSPGLACGKAIGAREFFSRLGEP